MRRKDIRSLLISPVIVSVFHTMSNQNANLLWFSLYVVSVVSCLFSIGAGDAEFMSFKAIYATPQEHDYRLNVFKDNLRRIKLHNDDPRHSWSMAMNEFGDLTAEVFASPS